MARAVRSIRLPLLCLFFSLANLTGQNPHDTIAAKPTAKTLTGSTLSTTRTATGQPQAAQPEPNTWMLLGTGAVVLLLLYTRRRVRVLTPRTADAS